jgi:hypothetical protein
MRKRKCSHPRASMTTRITSMCMLTTSLTRETPPP